MKRYRSALACLLAVLATPALAGSFTIAEGAPTPLLYASFVGLGVQAGYHHTTSANGGGLPASNAVAFRIEAVEAKWFVTRRVAVGAALFATIWDSRVQLGGFAPSVRATYVDAIPAVSASYLTRVTANAFQYATLQVEALPKSEAVSRSTTKLGASASYAFVQSSGFPGEAYVRAGCQWEFDESGLKSSSVHAGVGLRVGLGWWFMRRTQEVEPFHPGG